MMEEDDRKLSIASKQDETAQDGAAGVSVAKAARDTTDDAAEDHSEHVAGDDAERDHAEDATGDYSAHAEDASGDGPDRDDVDRADAEDVAGDDADRDPRRAEFLEDLPDVPELRPLIDAFTEGNYARLRSLERDLRSTSTDPELLALARELVERTEPDPLAKKLLGLAILFFLFIAAWVYLHHVH